MASRWMTIGASGPRWPSRGRALWLILGLLSCGAAGCRRVTGAPPHERCQLACQPPDQPELGRDARARCEQACQLTQARALRANCDRSFADYLSCLHRSATSASPSLSTWSAVEQGRLAANCEATYRSFFRCMEPCRERGVLRAATREVPHGGRTLLVQAELVQAGCDVPEPQATQRSPSGSPCQHSSVCSSERCGCAGSGLAYLAKACVDGVCADRDSACELGPLAVQGGGCPENAQKIPAGREP